MSSSITIPTTATTPGPGTTGSTILARIFAVDRLTVSTSAAALTLGAIPIADLLDWSTRVVLAIGVGLIPYAWLMHTIVRERAYESTAARLTAVGDALWVVASVAAIVLANETTSTVGIWIIAAQAVMVADIGLVKLIGWRRS